MLADKGEESMHLFYNPAICGVCLWDFVPYLPHKKDKAVQWVISYIYMLEDRNTQWIEKKARIEKEVLIISFSSTESTYLDYLTQF